MSSTAKKCSICSGQMASAGDMHIRVEGYTGVAGMFLGGWNQIAEKIQTFAVYRCPQCGKVDFYEAGK